MDSQCALFCIIHDSMLHGSYAVSLVMYRLQNVGLDVNSVLFYSISVLLCDSWMACYQIAATMQLIQL